MLRSDQFLHLYQDFRCGVSNFARINKCDVIAGGRSLRPGTMASVGTEVSVWALSAPSCFYFRPVLLSSENAFRPGGSAAPLTAAEPPVSSCRLAANYPLPAPESFAFVLDRRATECAGRCCAPEREYTLFALRRGLVIHGPGLCHSPACVQLLAVQNKPHTHLEPAFVADILAVLASLFDAGSAVANSCTVV